MSDKKLLIKNSISGISQQLVTAVLTFIGVPILIYHLGSENYGIFAMLSVIGNLSGLADLGMDRALIVYLSRQGRSQDSNFDIIVAVCIKLFILLFLLIILLIFEKFILFFLFNIPDTYQHVAQFLYRLLIFSNAFMILGMSFASILDAIQKVYLNSYIRFIYSVLYWGGLLVVTLLGFGLKGIGIVSLCTALLWLLMTIIISLRLWGTLSFTGVRANFKRILYKQFLYSSKIFTASILSLFFEPLSKILISHFVGLNGVTLFDVALRVRGQLMSLISKAIYPLGPYIANTPQSDSLSGFIIDISKKIQLLAVPSAILFVAISKILVFLWLGENDLDNFSVYVAVLCGSYLLFVPSTYPVYQYLYTKSLPEKNIWIQLLSVVVNVILFMIFYNIAGLYTILIANTGAYFASFLLSGFYAGRYLQASFSEQAGFIYKLSGMFVLLLSLTAAFHYWLSSSWGDLFIYPVIVIAGTILYIRFTKLISEKDIKTYFGNFPAMSKILSKIF